MRRVCIFFVMAMPIMAWCQMLEYRHYDMMSQEHLDSLSRPTLWHDDYELEQLALIYYNDFLAPEPCYIHSADSALKYLKLLYHFDYADCNHSQNNQYLYYPIVQVESILGCEHDSSVVRPRAKEEGFYFPNNYFLPCNLGDWQHDRHLDLCRIMESSQRKAENISSLLRAMSLPNLYDGAIAEADTVFRIIHWGNWGTHYAVSFQHETDGQWRAHFRQCDHLGLGFPDYRVEADAIVCEIDDSADLSDLRRLISDSSYLSLPARCFTGHVPDGGSYAFEWRMGDCYKIVAADYWVSRAKDKESRRVQRRVKMRFDTFMNQYVWCFL